MRTAGALVRGCETSTFDAVWAAFEWPVVTAASVAVTATAIRFEELRRTALAAVNLQHAAVDSSSRR